MDTFYYALKDGGNSLQRNKGAAFFKSSLSFIYFFILTMLLHAWLTAIYFEITEQKNIQDEMDSMDMVLQSNSGDYLLTLLSSLKTVFFIFSIGLFLFGILYLLIYFQRVMLLEKKDLIVKKMLGASALQVTSELLIEPMILIIPNCILSLFTAECLYSLLYNLSDSWFTSMLYPTGYFVLHIDFPLFGLFSLILTCLFFFLKQKVEKL